MLNLLVRASERFFRVDLGSFYNLQEEELIPVQHQEHQDNNSLMVLYRTPNLSGVIRNELGRQFYIAVNLTFLSRIIDLAQRAALTVTATPEEAPTPLTNNNMLSQSQVVALYQPRTVAVRQPSLMPRWH